MILLNFPRSKLSNASEYHAGLPIADAPKKISGVHKRCWRYNRNLTKLTEGEPNMNKSTENVPTAEVQAA